MCLSSSVVCEWEKKYQTQKVPKKDQLGQTGPRGCFEKKNQKIWSGQHNQTLIHRLPLNGKTASIHLCIFEYVAFQLRTRSKGNLILRILLLDCNE